MYIFIILIEKGLRELKFIYFTLNIKIILILLY
jgi:hypothetical protein